MGIVEAIHVGAGSRLPMESLDEVQIIADFGLEGDRKAKPGSKRQVLVMPAEVLDAFDLAPGAVRENITTRGIDVNALPPGTRVRFGAALLEATVSCTPCSFMDEVKPGLREALRGQRGMLFRVLVGGPVRVGDPVERVEGG